MVSIYYILVEYATHSSITYNARFFLIIARSFLIISHSGFTQKICIGSFLFHCFWLFSILIIAHYQDAL